MSIFSSMLNGQLGKFKKQLAPVVRAPVLPIAPALPGAAPVTSLPLPRNIAPPATSLPLPNGPFAAGVPKINPPVMARPNPGFQNWGALGNQQRLQRFLLGLHS